MDNFGKITYTIGKLTKKYIENHYWIFFLGTFKYRKRELEIAPFDARAPRWEDWRETPHICDENSFVH